MAPSAKPRSAKTPSRTSSALKAEIERSITDLGSTDFAVRERVSQLLWNAGDEAKPALEKAIQETDDFEVIYRARQILQSFEAGIYPDTPADIVMIIVQFRMGNFNVKQITAQRLKEKGKTDLLRQLIAKESNPDLREQLNQVLLASGSPGTTGSVRRRAPRVASASELAMEARRRLALRDIDGAEGVLRGVTSDESVRDFAALLLSRKKLDAEIAQLRANLKPSDEAGQRRLVWMLRAKGDLAGAVAAAKLVNNHLLVEDLLTEMADWKELAKIDAKANLLDALAIKQGGAQKLARLLVFCHLAGEKQACDLAAAAAVKALKKSQPGYLYLLNALILSDRVNQAIEATPSQDVKVAIAFELLVAQNRMKEALRLVKIDVPIPAKIDWTAWLKDGQGAVIPEHFFLAHKVVRVLHMAGEIERTRELIAAMLTVVGEKLAEDGRGEFALNLLDSEVAVGSHETSDALAAKLLALDLDNPEIVISRLYRDHQGTIAVLLWNAICKQFPGEDRPTALKHLRRLLTGKPDATAVEELRHLLLRIEPQLDSENIDGSSNNETSDLRASKLLALATLLHRHGQSKLATKYLARIGTAGVSSRSLIAQGKLHAEGKQWNEAVKSYEAAWTKDNRSASALYLLGWAQTKRGEEAEGRKRMELALMIPLADGESRRDLVQSLAELHQDDEAARQRLWLPRVAAMHDRSIIQTLMETGDAATGKADAANLATVWQRVAVELLSGSVFLSETRYYLHPPLLAHIARTRDLLHAGKTAEAIEELRQGEAVQPANIQLALDCDSELRKHGAAGEADALYRRMLDRQEALCRDFPRSGTFNNDLAWLAANLDRDLDKALTHAQRAVELEPQAAGILDTLAEVHFRRGNRSEAVRLSKCCLEMEPDGEQYKKQLARFEAKQ